MGPSRKTILETLSQWVKVCGWKTHKAELHRQLSPTLSLTSVGCCRTPKNLVLATDVGTCPRTVGQRETRGLQVMCVTTKTGRKGAECQECLFQWTENHNRDENSHNTRKRLSRGDCPGDFRILVPGRPH